MWCMSVVRIVHSSVHTKRRNKPPRPPMLVLRPYEVEDASTHSSTEHSVPVAVLGHGGEVQQYVYVARTLGPGRRGLQHVEQDVPPELWTRPLPLEPEAPQVRRIHSHGTIADASHAHQDDPHTPSSQDVLHEWRKAFSAYTPPRPEVPAPPTRAPPSGPPSPIAVPPTPPRRVPRLFRKRPSQPHDASVRDRASWWTRPLPRPLRRHISTIHLGSWGVGRRSALGLDHAER